MKPLPILKSIALTRLTLATLVGMTSLTVNALEPLPTHLNYRHQAPTYAPTESAQLLDKVGNQVALSVVDRSSNLPMPIYLYQGEYWVAGAPGQAYAIGLASRIKGRRALATVSVDGVNVLTGEDASVLQRGYVLSPATHYSIAGWRKSESEVATFNFAEPAASYAAQTDRSNNIGVIGIAVFPEQRQLPPPPPMLAPSPAIQADTLRAEKMPASKPSKPKAEMRADMRVNSGMKMAAPAGLGTQHGERETNVSTITAFNRESNNPAELIQLRYDTVDNLVTKGVLRWLPQAPVPAPVRIMMPRAFPNNSYVPDPPRPY
jgi:hypothetical protein